MISKLEAYVAGGLVILILLGSFYGLYRYQKYRADRLEEQNQSLALGQQVILEAQEATKKYNQEKAQVQRRAAREQAEIDSTVENRDDPAMRSLYERHGLLPPKGSSAPSRATGNP